MDQNSEHWRLKSDKMVMDRMATIPINAGVGGQADEDEIAANQTKDEDEIYASYFKVKRPIGGEKREKARSEDGVHNKDLLGDDELLQQDNRGIREHFAFRRMMFRVNTPVPKHDHWSQSAGYEVDTVTESATRKEMERLEQIGPMKFE